MTTDFRRDKTLIFKAYNRVAAHYDRHAVVVQKLGNSLLERLDWIRMTPTRIVDLGCGTGLLTAKLAQRYPKAQIIGVDAAWAMGQQWRRRRKWQQGWRAQMAVCAEGTALPFADQTVDLIFSHLALPCFDELDGVLAECQRILRPNGLFFFTSLGPDTLKELRNAWRQVDDFPHVVPFIDMHDLGDALIRAGFADPVMDVDCFTVTYPNTAALFSDLRLTGEINSLWSRRTTLTGKTRFRQMQALYEAQRDEMGLLPATCELVYGHGWRVERRPKTLGGAISIPVSQIKRAK